MYSLFTFIDVGMSYMDIDKAEKFRSQSTDNLKRMNFDKGPIIK